MIKPAKDWRTWRDANPHVDDEAFWDAIQADALEAAWDAASQYLQNTSVRARVWNAIQNLKPISERKVGRDE